MTPTSTFTFALNANGSNITGSTIDSISGQNTESLIVSLAAGTTLKLINTTPSSGTLHQVVANESVASITILQVG